MHALASMPRRPWVSLTGQPARHRATWSAKSWRSVESSPSRTVETTRRNESALETNISPSRTLRSSSSADEKGVWNDRVRRERLLAMVTKEAVSELRRTNGSSEIVEVVIVRRDVTSCLVDQNGREHAAHLSFSPASGGLHEACCQGAVMSVVDRRRQEDARGGTICRGACSEATMYFSGAGTFQKCSARGTFLRPDCQQRGRLAGQGCQVWSLTAKVSVLTFSEG
ncbi:hypothetical protein LX36DRAFT_361767 [Colletotrichum falcatum]|nr:hypothetical protein LX36DRAFT_361767 [Colletotrichum falcatum]